MLFIKQIQIDDFGKFISKSRKPTCYRSVTFKKMLTTAFFLEIPQNISIFVPSRWLPMMDLSVCSSVFWQMNVNNRTKMDEYRKILVEELASKGNKDAIREMAGWYKHDPMNTDFSSKTITHIKRYLLELAENGDTETMLFLGGMYYEGSKDFPQNYKEAFKWYEKAAEKRSPYGLCYLGYCYYHGRDIDVDYEKAYSCFSQAAFFDNPNAMYKLGDMYFYGQFVGEDKNAAFYWYNRAWRRNKNKYEKASVAYRLGKCYLHGYGVEQDLFLALKMLQTAEKDFFELVKKGEKFSAITLKKVKIEIDTARNRLYDLYDIQ